MREFAWILLMVLGALLPVDLRAQDSPRTGSVSGQLVDSISGLPVLRGWICESFDPSNRPAVGNCGRTDTLGRFRVGRLPFGHVGLWVTCEPKSHRFDATRMERITLQVDVRGEQTDVGATVVDALHCDQRPMTHRTGQFTGYYSFGFEESRFRWSEDTTLHIWVVGPRKPAAGMVIHWPPSTRENPWPCAFVRWYATLVGPSQYGHMGGSDYQMAVDSVIEVREASSEKCSR